MFRLTLLFICLQYSVTNVLGYHDTLASYFPEINNDLTKVTWVHAVNSREKLEAALKSDALMLEADIVLGHTSDEAKAKSEHPTAIMAHPPNTVSNLTLEEFLETFDKSGVNKGIKLDFKSRNAFSLSENIIDKLFSSYSRSYPIWLNADIIPGPVNASKEVVDADYFLTTCLSRYPSATISVGWSTRLEKGSTEGSYTQADVDKMTEALNNNMIIASTVTFAVRAALAARSVDILANLIATSSGESTTLTIWSSDDNDVVDVKGLRHLINKVGRDRVYLDLPQEIHTQVVSENSSGTSIASLSGIAFASVFVILFSMIL